MATTRRSLSLALVATGCALFLGTCGGSSHSIPTAPSTLSCGVERWPVKTLSDPDATGVDLTAPTNTTISDLNGFTAHCSGLPDGRSYPEEFRTYEVSGVVQLTRNEDDHDVHIALPDPGNSSQTIVVEVADPSCPGAVQSAYFATLKQARAEC